MGTIGDLLGGIDLSAFTTADDTPETTDATVPADNQRTTDTSADPADKNTHAAYSAGTPEEHTQALVTPPSDTPTGTEPTPHEIVMRAILDETTLEPSNARSELTLRGDLDMDDLSLYAVVAVIERALKRTFTDEQVRGWNTLGDLLDAAVN